MCEVHCSGVQADRSGVKEGVGGSSLLLTAQQSAGAPEQAQHGCPEGGCPSSGLHTYHHPLLQSREFFFFFGCMAGGILVLRPGIEPELPALKVQNLNHWTAPTLRLQDHHLISDVPEGRRLVPSLMVSLLSSIPPDLWSEFHIYWLSNCMNARFSDVSQM